MARQRGHIEPDPDCAEVYRQGYARYVELYERLEPMFV
jgi:hypothetical protein